MSADMKAGREMDALVAERVLGCTVKWYGGTPVCGCGITCNYSHADDDRDSQLSGDLSQYSTDMAAAWQVVESTARERDWRWDLAVRSGQYYAHIVPVWHAEDEWQVRAAATYEAQEATAPLAICRAALAAVQPTARGGGRAAV